MILPVLLTSCGGATDPGENRPPVPQVELILLNLADTCPFWTWFVVDVAATRDPETSFENLEIRLDYDGDGIWDTPFEPIQPEYRWYPPQPLSRWTVNVEVRDTRGAVAGAQASLDLEGLFPEEPDILISALRIERDRDGAQVDTVLVGEAFSITYYENCWLTGGPVEVKTEYKINGEVAATRVGDCYPAQEHCFGTGRTGFVLDSAGIYDIAVTIDADDRFVEDESNNTSVTTLVAVDPVGAPGHAGW